MRYVTYKLIKPGMILASPFYGPNFEILLSEGMKLNKNHIQRINDLGYAGAYIKDSISEGVEVRGLIDIETRMDIVKISRDILQETSLSGKRSRRRAGDIEDKIIMPVMQSLIMNKRRMVDMVDLKPFDDYLYYHNANVVTLSLLVGVELGLSESRLFDLGMAALLHDVGNVFIPKSILDKPGKLTPEEYEIVKSHSEIGFNYLRENFPISIESCMGALQHHENYDGSGYPSGLKKNEISIYGRIIAITDVYDALVSRRPFRGMVQPPSAMDFMAASSGIMFDPEVLEALRRAVAIYPTGFCVELDNGMDCIVVENHPGAPARPSVRPLDRPDIIINLHSDPQYNLLGVAEIIDYTGG